MTSDPNVPSSGFSPREIYAFALRRWIWVAAFILAGALAGWGISSLRQPLYEARAVFSFNIDYTLSGVLTDIEEDQALEAAGDLLNSSQVRDEVLARMPALNLTLSADELKGSLSIERRNSAWLVIVRRADGEQAARIANLWGQVFDEVYRDAYGHALAADGLQRYLQSLESCLRETVASEPVQAGCQLSDLAKVQAQMASTGEQIRKERQAGKNIFAGMLYEWSEKASPASSPAWFDGNKFILLGALAGFLLSLWFVEAWPVRRKV